VPVEIMAESLIQCGEAPHRGLSYRRLLRRLRRAISLNRTTIIFANTRAFAEKLTHDLREVPAEGTERGWVIAVHHSALDAERRRKIESSLRSGQIRAVVTSTSLELGVDIGTVDLVVQIGLPGGVARCLQRVGRAGHRPGAGARGLLLAAAPGELIGAMITARAAQAGAVEPLRMITAPLDVVCQQLVGMACEGEQSVASAFELLRKAGPMSQLSQTDFDDCLASLSGELAAPKPTGGNVHETSPRWSSPRIWKHDGRFGLQRRRVAQWFRSNVGTIYSEETARVIERGVAVGTIEAAYAERLVPGDRFVLDGRSWELRRQAQLTLLVEPASGEPSLPRWTSDHQSVSFELATELAAFRAEAGLRLDKEGPAQFRSWLRTTFDVDDAAAAVILELFEAQAQWSEVPSPPDLLVEESPSHQGEGSLYAFHAPLHRAACEALGRATAARLGRRFGRDLALNVADFGWSIRLAESITPELSAEAIAPLFDPARFAEDVLEGVDRGELLSRRFRHVAETALMVLRNPERGRRVRVGGLNWVASRLFPLVKAHCPDHPVLRETRREVLEDILDVPAAERWLRSCPPVRYRMLPGISPFAAAWIERGPTEALCFEPPAMALRRLHARLTLSSC
jgi:ATP-dependent Lhr-like helicase